MEKGFRELHTRIIMQNDEIKMQNKNHREGGYFLATCIPVAVVFKNCAK